MVLDRKKKERNVLEKNCEDFFFLLLTSCMGNELVMYKCLHPSHFRLLITLMVKKNRIIVKNLHLVHYSRYLSNNKKRSNSIAFTKIF